MLIATFNCNSVRQRLDIILNWLETHQPDCLGLQETKVVDDQFPALELAAAGWKASFRGEKSYNGVALITRSEPDEVSFGLDDGDDGASETRMVHVKLGDVHVINSYVPQGTGFDSPKFAFKLEWFKRVRAYLEKRFDPTKDKVVWIGDLNVAPTPIDVYAHEKIWPHVCHCQEVTDAFEGVTSWGLVDVFRKHLPGPGNYTFFDYRMKWAIKANQGWRIDHILATPPMAETSETCFVDLEPRKEPKPSDHTFVAARFGS
jgi:exodeoxyribonuclease-3